VRDWPLMPIRGSIEGFYGIPWSHQARLDHFPFYGRRKLNTYIYTPKDDLLLRSKWRDLYEGEALEDMAELVETATKNHVHFTYALSPGNDITYGSDDDFAATVKKFDQVRDLGVTSFYIALDDIPTELNEEDAAQFDSLAAAQAHYLNRLQDEYVKANDLEPLQTVPTEYWGSEPLGLQDRLRHRDRPGHPRAVDRRGRVLPAGHRGFRGQRPRRATTPSTSTCGTTSRSTTGAATASS
jgi:hyaluronoglucosaminidase